MINLTPINKKIQKRLFEKMKVLGRETSADTNQSSQGGLTHKDMATRSTFLRMTSGQVNPVILMGGKLKDDGSMSGGYDDIYGSRSYMTSTYEGIALTSENLEDIGYEYQEETTLENKLKRPMPGVKGVDVTFKGGVRALREATITWTCWDFKELDFLMPHFLAHGKTVMVEWGWVYDTDTLQKLPDFVKTDEVSGNKYLSADIYNNYRKDIFNSNGDFDMMVGIIKNFEFTTREDGAFDCTTILTSVGASIMENPQANEVALDPNITYNLSINEDDRETAQKLTKAVGETGQEDTQRGDMNSLVSLNTSVSLKLFIKEIDRYLITDVLKGNEAKEFVIPKENTIDDAAGAFVWKPNRYMIAANGMGVSPINSIEKQVRGNGLEGTWLPSAGSTARQNSYWVRWGWFEDNILSKFLSVTSKPNNETEEKLVNPIITEFRSIERNLNQDKNDSKKYESVRIKNNRELQTTNINHYILTGQFYPVKPTSFDVDGDIETLRGDSSYLRSLAKIVNEPKNFSPFATKSDKIEVVREVYEEEIISDWPGKKFDEKKLVLKGKEQREVKVPGKHGYLRNMLINTELIKQAFGVSEGDTFTVESINVIESVESLFSLLNQELNFWNYKITVDEVETSRAKIIDDQVTNFDFDKTTTDQKSFIEGGEVTSINSGEEGVFFFPVWRSDSIVKRQNITAKIPDEMQLSIMYGSNMDQLKDFANPGSQFAEKEGVLAGGLFNKHQDAHKGGLDIAIRNKDTRNLGVYHGIKDNGEPFDDASDSLNKNLPTGYDDIQQFLKDNSEILEKTFETRLTQLNKDLKISSQTQAAFSSSYDSSVPPPFVRSLELSQLRELLIFEKKREGIFGYNEGELTKLMGSTFYETGEMKPQFKRSVSYLTTQHGINKQANTPLLIPLELELEIDGIGGIYPGNSYHSTYVPSRYQQNTVFQCFDVNHRLDSSGWTVTLTGKMRATMNNIFDGFKKLEELQGEQFKNYVDKATSTEDLKLRIAEWEARRNELSGGRPDARSAERLRQFDLENPRPE
jgi:hypothetical protein